MIGHFRPTRFSIFHRYKDLVLPRDKNLKCKSRLSVRPTHGESLTSRSIFLMNLVLFPFEQNADRLKSWPFEKLKMYYIFTIICMLHKFCSRELAKLPKCSFTVSVEWKNDIQFQVQAGRIYAISTNRTSCSKKYFIPRWYLKQLRHRDDRRDPIETGNSAPPVLLVKPMTLRPIKRGSDLTLYPTYDGSIHFFSVKSNLTFVKIGS